MIKAFAGLRVLDFTTTIAGPHCTRLLADLGADVVKVEAPEGDVMRSRLPLRNGASSYFGQLNAGKQSVVLDLKQERAVEAARRLAGQVDILVENYRPGVMRRLVVHFEGQTSGIDISQGVKRHQVINQATFAEKWLQRSGRIARTAFARDGTRPLGAAPGTSSRRVHADAGPGFRLAAHAGVARDPSRSMQGHVRRRQPGISRSRTSVTCRTGVEVLFHPYVRSIAELLPKRGREFDVIMLSRHYVARASRYGAPVRAERAGRVRHRGPALPARGAAGGARRRQHRRRRRQREARRRARDDRARPT